MRFKKINEDINLRYSDYVTMYTGGVHIDETDVDLMFKIITHGNINIESLSFIRVLRKNNKKIDDAFHSLCKTVMRDFIYEMSLTKLLYALKHVDHKTIDYDKYVRDFKDFITQQGIKK